MWEACPSRFAPRRAVAASVARRPSATKSAECLSCSPNCAGEPASQGLRNGAGRHGGQGACRHRTAVRRMPLSCFLAPVCRHRQPRHRGIPQQRVPPASPPSPALDGPDDADEEPAPVRVVLAAARGKLLGAGRVGADPTLPHERAGAHVLLDPAACELELRGLSASVIWVGVLCVMELRMGQPDAACARAASARTSRNRKRIAHDGGEQAGPPQHERCLQWGDDARRPRRGRGRRRRLVTPLAQLCHGLAPAPHLSRRPRLASQETCSWSSQAPCGLEDQASGRRVFTDSAERRRNPGELK